MKATIVGLGNYADTTCYFCNSSSPSLFVVPEGEIDDVPACNKCVGKGKIGDEVEITPWHLRAWKKG